MDIPGYIVSNPICRCVINQFEKDIDWQDLEMYVYFWTDYGIRPSAQFTDIYGDTYDVEVDYSNVSPRKGKYTVLARLNNVPYYYSYAISNYSPVFTLM
jgi:hypothetical protein